MKTTTTAALWTAGIVVATTLYHLHKIHTAIRSVPRQQIKSKDSIPSSLAQSTAVLAIVNPHAHPPTQDSRWITLHVPALSISNDEEILARFVKGFCGQVLAPGRTILIALKKEFTHFNALTHIPIALHIWSVSQLSPRTLPPLHALLFGAFRVVDVSIDDEDIEQGQGEFGDGSRTRTRTSYVDFAFGSDGGGMAGVHRFSVMRERGGGQGEGEEKGKEVVTIAFDHVGCNPREDKPLGPQVLKTPHLWHAMLLFREGVAEVLKGL